jgi:V/A-type H+/Na+-transporting ATPase subunit E
MRMSKAASDTLESVSGQLESELLAELEDGKKQALAALESSKRETMAAVSKVLDGGAKQAEALRRQLIGSAELEVRNAKLETLERAVVEVFERATEKLKAMSGARYEKALVALISEGAGVLGPKAKVYCNPKDRKAVASAMSKVGGGQSKPTLVKEGIQAIGGVVMSSPDGTVKFDNTFEARLERMRPTLRMDVSSALSAE